ncbi:MAG: outer membrane beta-barrel protein [Gemmatimonadota bacterium]|jgi:hypothetical protein
MRNPRLAALVALMVVTTASSALAQGRTFGVRAGTSISTLDVSVDDVFDEENRTGLVAGAFYNQSFGLLGYQVEVLYANRGTAFQGGGSIDLAYIEVPALLKIGVPVGLLRPGVFGGVALGFNVACDLEDEGGKTSCDDIAEFSVNRTDLNAVFGADLQLGLGGLSLWGDGRYYLGLSDVGEIEDVTVNFKNRSWEFTAGIGIPLL